MQNREKNWIILYWPRYTDNTRGDGVLVYSGDGVLSDGARW